MPKFRHVIWLPTKVCLFFFKFGNNEIFRFASADSISRDSKLRKYSRDSGKCLIFEIFRVGNFKSDKFGPRTKYFDYSQERTQIRFRWISHFRNPRKSRRYFQCFAGAEPASSRFRPRAASKWPESSKILLLGRTRRKVRQKDGAIRAVLPAESDDHFDANGSATSARIQKARFARRRATRLATFGTIRQSIRRERAWSSSRHQESSWYFKKRSIFSNFENSRVSQSSTTGAACWILPRNGRKRKN